MLFFLHISDLVSYLERILTPTDPYTERAQLNFRPRDAKKEILGECKDKKCMKGHVRIKLYYLKQ